MGEGLPSPSPSLCERDNQGGKMADNLPGEGREGERGESNDVVHNSSSSSAAFLGELNLVMMVAFLTLSADDLDDEPDKSIAGEEEPVTKLKRRRHRQPDGLKVADRQSVPRSQKPKTLDSRHGRKM